MNEQVLIVGAGPVGLTMAIELARYRVKLRIVDKAPRRTDKSKALVLWSRTLELLDRAGCSQALVAAGHKVDAARIVAGGRTVGRVSFADVQTPHPYGLMLPQSETERLLDAHLADLGISVERHVELLHFSETNRSVAATLRHADGREEALETAWLIGCDGAHSTVRHTLGLQFLGDTLATDWILADIHLAGEGLSASELAVFWHEDGLLAVFPISPGRVRVVADRGRSERLQPADPTLDEVQAVVERRGPGGLTVSDPVWLSSFRINERKVADYRSGRVFVAGDAAHVHSPAGGQGMNTGIQDAVNLGWKLAMVCQGTCAASNLLESYSVERSAVGEQVLTATGRLTTIGVMKSHTAQAIRNMIGGFLFGLSPVRRIAAETLAEVSVGYPASPLNGAAAHGIDGPAPGERMAPVGIQSPVGSGPQPQFALFAPDGEAVSRLRRDFPALLEPSVRAAPASGGMWLVRPDGYTACVAKDGDFGVIAEYLRAFASRVTVG